MKSIERPLLHLRSPFSRLLTLTMVARSWVNLHLSPLVHRPCFEVQHSGIINNHLFLEVPLHGQAGQKSADRLPLWALNITFVKSKQISSFMLFPYLSVAADSTVPLREGVTGLPGAFWG